MLLNIHYIFLLILSMLFSKELLAQNKDFEANGEFEPQENSYWFPDWPLVKRSWSFSPILAYRQRRTDVAGSRIDTSATEIGAALSLRDYDIIPNNAPGLSFRPFVGYTWGYQSARTSSVTMNSKTASAYNRNWYGANFTFLYRFYKQTLTLTLGKVLYDDDFQDVRLFEISNNFGFKLLSHLSTHLAITYQWIYGDQLKNQFEDNLDSWIYLQPQFSLFDTLIQIGPGVNKRKAFTYVDGSKEQVSNSSQTYFLGRSRMNFFLGLELILETHYVFDANKKINGTGIVFNQLPHQDLSEPPDAISLPADSLNTYVFFGIPNIIAGIGFGYQVNHLTINYSSTKNRQSYRDQGFTTYYSLRY